jgi:hypothetical protein
MNILQTGKQNYQSTEVQLEPGFIRGPAPFNIHKPKASIRPGSELLPGAYALTDAILLMNTKVRPLFLDIITTINENESDPTFSELFNVMVNYFDSGEDADFSEIMTRFKHDEYIIKINSLTKDFINEAFTIHLPDFYILDHNGKEIKHKPKPRNLIKDFNDALMLQVGVQFSAFLKANGLSLNESDRASMGADFDLVSNPDKPSTDTLRQRKINIHKDVENNHWSFLSYATLLDHAKRFYFIKVVNKYSPKNINEYFTNIPEKYYDVVTSTLSHETKMFRAIVRI